MNKSSKAAAHWLWAEYLPEAGSPKGQALNTPETEAKEEPFSIARSASSQVPCRSWGSQRRHSARLRSLGAIHLRHKKRDPFANGTAHLGRCRLPFLELAWRLT